MEGQGGSGGSKKDQAVLRVLNRRGAKEQAPPHDGGEAFAEELVICVALSQLSDLRLMTQPLIGIAAFFLLLFAALLL